MAIVKFEAHEITVRDSDGFWNATEMAQIFGKRINNFLRNEQTKSYLNALVESRNVDLESVALNRVTIGSLVQVTQGGEDQGTWVDPEIGLRLAAWLNPRFEVWVYKMIRILFSEGEVKLKDHIHELELLTDEMANDLVLKGRSIDRMKYDIDELKEMAQWRQENSF